MDDWRRVREEVLERLVPGPTERKRLEDFTQSLTEDLQDHLRGEDYDVSVEVHGSVSRDTWLRGQRDIDVFLVLNIEEGWNRIEGILDALKVYLGSGWVEAYAEHPYLRVCLDGFTVEFVPCFRIARGDELISSTDRTPLHTGYVSSTMEPGQADEVRLLKQFMKGIHVYGAEIKVQGFSGYLCELLILRYGGFRGVLEAAASWRSGEVIQMEDQRNSGELRKLFSDPLIVPDPVDPVRNVASAVSEEAYWTFIAASRFFLEDPSEGFFFPKKRDIGESQVLRMVKDHPLDILFLVIRGGDHQVPDVLWGQLHKTRDAIINYLEECGFRVERAAFWSDDEDLNVLTIELGSATIPRAAKQYGPPVRMRDDSRGFLKTHIGDEETVSGPGVEGDRWWVIKRRDIHCAERALRTVLEEGRDIGISRGIRESMRQGYNILRDEEIEDYLTEDLCLFLDDFIRGCPDWID
ncbi:MAG: CCA tRNA nucleotidyltransferase [Candidatus Bathyarchaeia archaeon]